MRNSATVIPAEDELWAQGILGTSSPTTLQCTIFYYVGLQFVLRGIQEQHDLLISQLIRYPPETSTYSKDVYYQYVEYISKITSIGLRTPR